MSKLESYIYHKEDAGVIYCGDCLEILSLLEDNSVDLVLTDPPYGTVDGRGKTWRQGEQFNPGDWDKELPITWIPFGLKVLRDGHWWFVFTDSLSVKLIWDNFESCGGKGKEVFAWIKPAYAPQPRKNFTSAFELAVCGTKGSVQVWYGGGHCPNYLIHNTSNMYLDNTEHPTQKPLYLLNWLLGRLSQSDEIVLDPFLGSGTTAVAAKNLGRKFIGIEIEEKYCKIAVDRLRQGVLEL